MIRSFEIDIAGTHFKFDTLSSKTLQAFQVYVKHEGKRLRFHMQRKENSFVITDPSVCPADYLALEADLSEAILKSQDEAVAIP